MSELTAQLLDRLVPLRSLSRVLGWLADRRWGLVTTAVIRAFVKRYRVNLSEAQVTSADGYASFNEFFTRPLREGVRPFCAAPQLACPVDGCISELGPIEQGQILQAKGQQYSLAQLLGDEALAAGFAGGDFATIYLSPKDYHRIHMPIAGRLTEMLHIPGSLFSVNPASVQSIPALFARNERVVCQFDTELGPMAMVLVGATVVGSIETTWAGVVTPPRQTEVRRWQYREREIRLARGDEMGRFRLGSTVILVFGAKAVTLASSLAAGVPVRLGQIFATPISPASN